MEAKQQIKDFFIFNDKNWKYNSSTASSQGSKKSMNPKAPRVVTDMHMGETIQIMILALGN